MASAGAQAPASAAGAAPTQQGGTGDGAAERKAFMTDVQGAVGRDRTGSAGPGRPAAGRTTQKVDIRAMGRVRALNTQLGELVGTLSEKVQRVLDKQENEFLSAYRAHAYQVQKELQSWKDKADAARLKQERDKKLERLAEECAWFRKEALRLNKFTQALKRDLTTLREKLEHVEEDRDWNVEQLKAAKREIKALRAELETAVDGQRQREAQAEHLEAQLSRERGAAQEARAAAAAATAPRGAGRSAATAGASGRFPPLVAAAGPSGSLRSGGADSGPSARAGAAAAGAGGGVRAAQLQQLEAKVERLRSQLGAEKSKVKQLRSARAAEKTREAELRELFVACVEDVRKEVAARRVRGRGGSGRFGPGASALGLAPIESLTATDRRAVVHRLVQDDYVLECLHDLLFGDQGGASPLPTAMAATGGSRAPTPQGGAQAGSRPQQPPRRGGSGAGRSGLRSGRSLEEAKQPGEDTGLSGRDLAMIANGSLGVKGARAR